MTPWTAARQASLPFTISQSLLKLMAVESVILFKCLILCHPLLLLPSIFSSIRVFSSDLVLCIKWLKYWIFSFNVSPSNEYSGLIFFRIAWFVLLAVHGTLKSLLQHHSFKASVLRAHPFYVPALRSIHDYQKNHSFDSMDLYWQGMSLLLNTLSRFVIAFLPRVSMF